jgi:selenocysteine lyase/cysteine desulfurase
VRDEVRSFVGAPPGDEVVLVRNTTEAINVLSAALPRGTRVLSSSVEHHANMLPWRRHDLQLLAFPASPTRCVQPARTRCDARGRASTSSR